MGFSVGSVRVGVASAVDEVEDGAMPESFTPSLEIEGGVSLLGGLGSRGAAPTTRTNEREGDKRSEAAERLHCM